MTCATREADAAFADLICGDPQWLRTEFDALISASFGEPPAPPPAPPRVPRRPGSTPPPVRPPTPGPPAAAFRDAATPGYGRQRSPPARFP